MMSSESQQNLLYMTICLYIRATGYICQCFLLFVWGLFVVWVCLGFLLFWGLFCLLGFSFGWLVSILFLETMVSPSQARLAQTIYPDVPVEINLFPCLFRPKWLVSRDPALTPQAQE